MCQSSNRVFDDSNKSNDFEESNQRKLNSASVWYHSHVGDPGVDWRMILKWIFKKWDGGMDGIELAGDRDRWLALMNAVMNLGVP
jgi:hypothetical protein